MFAGKTTNFEKKGGFMQDLNDLGLNQATVSTVGCIVMTLLGSYGQLHQIGKIWRSKKAERVSGLMSVIMFTLFAGYLVRGIAEVRMMYLVQGILRAGFFVPIVVGVIRFGVFTKGNWAELALGLVTLVAMSVFDSFRVVGFTSVMHIGLIGAAHQAWSVRRANGQVSFSFYITMLLSVSFQVWYGWYYNDLALLIPCLGFATLYSVILGLMVKNLRTKNTVASG